MKKFFLGFILSVLLIVGCFYYLQYEFGIQIPKVNPVTGDTCGIVIYHSNVLDFSDWDPHSIDGYLTPDVIPDRYSVGQITAGTYLNPDGSTGWGYGFFDGDCFVETGKVLYIGDSVFSSSQEPRYRLPFVLP